MPTHVERVWRQGENRGSEEGKGQRAGQKEKQLPEVSGRYEERMQTLHILSACLIRRLGLPRGLKTLAVFQHCQCWLPNLRPSNREKHRLAINPQKGNEKANTWDNSKKRRTNKWGGPGLPCCFNQPKGTGARMPAYPQRLHGARCNHTRRRTPGTNPATPCLSSRWCPSTTARRSGVSPAHLAVCGNPFPQTRRCLPKPLGLHLCCTGPSIQSETR